MVPAIFAESGYLLAGNVDFPETLNTLFSYLSLTEDGYFYGTLIFLFFYLFIYLFFLIESLVSPLLLLGQ